MSKTIPGLAEAIPKLLKAVATILEGTCKRVDVNPDIKVYECKNVIRIDLKIKEEVDQ